MREILRLFSFTIGHRASGASLEGEEKLGKNAFLIDVRVESTARMRRTWRSPYGGRLGIVSAIEPNDAYGPYIIEFEDGLHFRYHRQELEPVLAGSAYFYQRALGKLCGLIRSFRGRPA
jgi:hypothetical protein